MGAQELRGRFITSVPRHKIMCLVQIPNLLCHLFSFVFFFYVLSYLTGLWRVLLLERSLEKKAGG